MIQASHVPGQHRTQWREFFLCRRRPAGSLPQPRSSPAHASAPQVIHVHGLGFARDVVGLRRARLRSCSRITPIGHRILAPGVLAPRRGGGGCRFCAREQAEFSRAVCCRHMSSIRNPGIHQPFLARRSRGGARRHRIAGDPRVVGGASRPEQGSAHRARGSGRAREELPRLSCGAALARRRYSRVPRALRRTRGRTSACTCWAGCRMSKSRAHARRRPVRAR